jgi:hypothetical protein
MYVRVTRGHFDPSRYDEVKRAVDERLVPAITQLPGFRGYTGGVHHGAGTLVAISVWDEQEQAALIAGQRGMFEELGVRFEAAEMFEVIAQA